MDKKLISDMVEQQREEKRITTRKFMLNRSMIVIWRKMRSDAE